MPGARLASFRLGDRSELLVEHLLAGFAFTTRVPRQEDIGIDFLCSLITGYNGERLLKAGPFFAAQAKRPKEKLTYEKPHELEWITRRENSRVQADSDALVGFCANRLQEGGLYLLLLLLLSRTH